MKAEIYQTSMPPVKRTPSPSDRAIGNRIRQWRADNRLSGQDLADRLGVTRGAVGNWEVGQGIKRENLQKIADTYKISYEWLATGRGSPEATTQPESIDSRLKMLPPDLSEELHETIDVLIERAIERSSRRAQ